MVRRHPSLHARSAMGVSTLLTLGVASAGLAVVAVGWLDGPPVHTNPAPVELVPDPPPRAEFVLPPAPPAAEPSWPKNDAALDTAEARIEPPSPASVSAPVETGVSPPTDTMPPRLAPPAEAPPPPPPAVERAAVPQVEEPPSPEGAPGTRPTPETVQHPAATGSTKPVSRPPTAARLAARRETSPTRETRTRPAKPEPKPARTARREPTVTGAVTPARGPAAIPAQAAPAPAAASGGSPSVNNLFDALLNPQKERDRVSAGSRAP